jgi:hypothetical protein
VRHFARLTGTVVAAVRPATQTRPSLQKLIKAQLAPLSPFLQPTMNRAYRRIIHTVTDVISSDR